MPTTSFSNTSKDTLSTACTSPSSLGKATNRFRTESTASTGTSAGRSGSTDCSSSTGTSPLTLTPYRSPDGLGVEGVAQAVADEVHAHHGDEDGEAREVQEVRLRRADVALGVGQHAPPRRRRRLHAETEERQRGLRDDGGGDGERGVDQDGPDGVGDEVAHDDALVRRARRPGRLDVLLL